LGRACEFDYFGRAQACKALRAEGYEVVLVNSNPATIMTDPELANRTYIEPLTKEYLEEILIKEKGLMRCSRLSGGQTALNLAVELAEGGTLEKHKVEMIGASLRAIKVAEDRLWFKDACRKIGLEVPASALVNNAQDALRLCDQLGFPLVIRPSFTPGRDRRRDLRTTRKSLQTPSRTPPGHESRSRSAGGRIRARLERVRTRSDARFSATNTFVVICTIENFDPMGVHTGRFDNGRAPPQTADRQGIPADARLPRPAIIREVGVETGGSNVQFAINPENGKMVVIEMNPARFHAVLRLASKATGVSDRQDRRAPWAVGMTLDEIPNDITQKTPRVFRADH